MFDWLKRKGAKKAPGEGAVGDEKPLFEAVTEGIYLTDAAGRIVFMNRAAGELLGYGQKDVIGKNSHSIFHHSRPAGTPYQEKNCPISRVLSTGVARRLMDEWFCAKGGRFVPVDCNAAPILKDGKVSGLIVAFGDATARRRYEAALKKAKEEAELVLNLAPSAIYMVDTQRRVLTWNRRAAEITGFSAEEVIGQPCSVFADMPCRMGCGLLEESVPKPINCAECTVRTKDGRIRIISKNADVIRDPDGRIIGGVESFDDVTERKLAEAKMAEQEATFKAITSSAHDAIILIDNDGKVSFWNEAAEKMLGWRSEEALGHDLHALIAPERYREANAKAFGTFRETGAGAAVGRTLELAALRKDGSEITVDLSLSALKLDGKWCAVGILRDITERKHSEELLKASQARLDLALRSSHMGVWSLEIPENRRVFDEKACELLGISGGKFGGTAAEFFAVVHPEDLPALKEALRQTLETGAPYAPEYRAVWPDGTIKYISARGRLERSPDGKPLRMNGVIWDVTRTRAAQEALRASEDKYRSIFESFLDLYYQADLTGKVLVVSPSVERLSGWTVEEVLRMNVLDLYADPGERAGLLAELQKKGYVTGYEITLKRKDGVCIPTLVSARVRTDAQGRPAGVEGTLRDITEIKRTREELRKAKEAAESANRAKSDFLANMSHEIRTPMNSIIGMAEILLDSSLDEEQRRHLKTIQNSADALLYIISDILDISRIEAGLMKIEREAYSPREVAESVAEMFAQRAAAKDIELILKVSMDMPASVMGDANRLRQIFINLVGNALKFTSKGQIKMSAEYLKGAAAGWLVFSVADTGVGISAENQKKLFRKFSQVDDSSTRRYGGTGLGLSISKALVEMMGGSVSLESAEGKGSVFSFRLPCEEAPAGPAAREDFVSFSGMRALLVDDNPDSLEILSQNMAAWGFTTSLASSAPEALKAMKASGKFDLVVVDHQMPGDGERFLAEAIDAGAAAGAKIIMVSSKVEGIPDSVKPSVSAFLAKPVTRSILFNTILRVFRPAGSLPEQPEVSRTAAGHSHLKILVVEDNIDNQNLARILLEKGGYRLDIASNGREALEKCAAFDYDLVLMDIQMPEMDGHEAAFQLRKTEAYRRTPIIALTAHGLESDVQKSLSLGMNAHITKPLKKSLLYAALDKWLDHRRKVLVVDDSADNQLLVEMFLKGETGLRLYRASNGREALEMMERNIFSLVLMDVEMPEMDGLTAVRNLRSRPGGKEVPVIAFSAHEEPAKIKECMDAGFTDYLLKPVKKTRLLEKMHKYL